MTPTYDLLVTRKWFSTKSTISEVTGWNPEQINLGYILEDEARPDNVKIAGCTCIPAGDYKVVINMSSRFKRLMPLIYNQDDFSVKCGNFKFEGVRLHSGNTDADTEGCLLTGKSKGKDIVIESRDQFTEVFSFIQKHPSMRDLGYVRLRIVNNPVQV